MNGERPLRITRRLPVPLTPGGIEPHADVGQPFLQAAAYRCLMILLVAHHPQVITQRPGIIDHARGIALKLVAAAGGVGPGVADNLGVIFIAESQRKGDGYCGHGFLSAGLIAPACVLAGKGNVEAHTVMKTVAVTRLQLRIPAPAVPVILRGA